MISGCIVINPISLQRKAFNSKQFFFLSDQAKKKNTI